MDFLFYFMIALLVLLVQIKWLVAICTAALIHEAGHILALLGSGAQIQKIQMEQHGIRIQSGKIPANKVLLCTLAGPMFSLLLALIYPFLPRLAICGLIQGLYNLLPIYPLDGGRAVRIIWKRNRKIPCKELN